MSKSTLTVTDIQTQTATHLTAIELGLGSFLHAFKIPFTGHFLSLNQGFFLSSMVRTLSTTTNKSRFELSQLTFETSIMTALLKSFSPAGQKWGPMLSISLQGVFYSVGIFIFGANIIGSLIGILLLSLWAFIQPLITLIISFGFSDLQKVYLFYVQRLETDYHVSSQSLKLTVMVFIFIKFLLATITVIAAYCLKPQKIKALQEKIINRKKIELTQHRGEVSVHKKVFKDVTRPLFLVSFFLTFVFLFITDISLVELAWKMLRPLGVAVLLFYILRSSLTQKILLKLISRSDYLKSLYDRSQKIFNQLN